jgi:hypothetical protein
VLKGAASGADGGTLAFAKGTTSVVKTANSAGSAGTAGITGAAIGAGRTLSDTGTSNYYLVSITSEGNDDAHTIQATTEATDVTLDGSTVAGS